jgi:hypothetical protein
MALSINRTFSKQKFNLFLLFCYDENRAYKSEFMAIKTEPQKLADLLQTRKSKKPPAYEWQDLALRIIKDLGIPAFKRNSVFKACKENDKYVIERCLNETKELCRTGQKWKYFFKLVGGKGISDDQQKQGG